MPCAVPVKMPLVIPLPLVFLRLVSIPSLSGGILRLCILIGQSRSRLFLPMILQLYASCRHGCGGRIPSRLRRLFSSALVHMALCHMIHNLFRYPHLRTIHHSKHRNLNAKHQAGQNGHVYKHKAPFQFPDHNNHHSRSCYPFPGQYRKTALPRQCCLLSRQYPTPRTVLMETVDSICVSFLRRKDMYTSTLLYSASDS